VWGGEGWEVYNNRGEGVKRTSVRQRDTQPETRDADTIDSVSVCVCVKKRSVCVSVSVCV